MIRSLFRRSTLNYEKTTGLIYVSKGESQLAMRSEVGIRTSLIGFCVVEETPEAKIGYRTAGGRVYPALVFKDPTITLSSKPVLNRWAGIGGGLGAFNMLEEYSRVLSTEGVYTPEYFGAFGYSFGVSIALGLTHFYLKRWRHQRFLSNIKVIQDQSRRILEEIRKEL